MSPKFDIFLACAPKDYSKLPYVITSIAENIKGFDNLIICTPTVIPNAITTKFPIMYYTYLDENGLPGVSRTLWRFRPNWCFQQHLKMFQQVTKDWYLTIDCDTIINRPMKFFENDQPICWRGVDQHYPPYFVFMGCMLNLEKVSDHTYIADMNLFHRPIINEMLQRAGYNSIQEFIKKSQEVTNQNCHIGEPEIYGNYCKKYYPNLYIEKDLQQAPFVGRHQQNVEGSVYSEDEILAAIKASKGLPYDTISLHSWLNEGDQKNASDSIRDQA